MAGFADLNLRLNYWYINHRDQLKKWWMIAFLAFDGIVLVFWVVAAFVARTDGRAVQRQLVERSQASLFSASVRSELASPLIVGTPLAVPAGTKTVDLIVELKNPNGPYVAESVHYRFAYGDQALPARQTFLWPEASRYVFESNLPVQAGKTPVFELLGVAWRRPKQPEILSQISFKVEQVSFDVSALTTGTPPQPAPRVQATMVNDSIHAFREVEVSIAVLDRDRPVAAERVVVDNWQSFAKQTVNAQWVRTIPAGAKVLIIPHVNPLDERNFLRN